MTLHPPLAPEGADPRPLVAHVIDELPPDGAERLVVDVLRRRSERFRFVVVCLVRGGVLEAELAQLGVPVVTLGRHGGPLSLLWRLATWLRRERVAVVHTHLFMADAYGRVAARLAGVKAVFSTVHSVNAWRTPVHRWIDRVLAYASTRVIACSDEVAGMLIQRGPLPAKRVVAVANGIDLRRFLSLDEAQARKAVREEFGVAPDCLLLGVVGRLHPAKGHEDLLQALAELRQQTRMSFCCLFIGDGELRAPLQAQVQALGLADTVLFTGLRSDVPRLLAALDVMVMPSRWEGLPMALLEAMACACAVVATRVGGIPDVVTHDVHGLLAEARAPSTLTAQLRRVLSDAPLRQRLGAAAREVVLQRFDAQRTANAYEALYAQGLGWPASPWEAPSGAPSPSSGEVRS